MSTPEKNTPKKKLFCHTLLFVLTGINTIIGKGQKERLGAVIKPAKISAPQDVFS